MSELKFRDGKRVVPDYMDTLMQGVPTHKLTYEQAVAAMNRQMASNHVEKAVDKMVARHFAENRNR